MTPRYLSALEVATRAGRSRSQINRDAAAGKIRTDHTVGGARAFALADVETYLQASA